MSHDKLHVPRVLSVVIAALMAAQATAGVLSPGSYRDPLWARSAWFGNDLVTSIVAVPLLVLGVTLARGGSARGLLVWLGMLGYGVYNYAYYLFGASLNVFFPFYVALFVLSILALVIALPRIDAGAIAARFDPRTRVRLVGGYLSFVGLGLGIVWLIQWAVYVVHGRAPDVGPDAFRLIAALDLSLMSTGLVGGGVLLWRRSAWGYVIASIAGVQAATYTLVLTVGSLVAGRAGVAGAAAQVPLWIACTVLTAAAMGLLLGGVRDARPAAAALPGNTPA